MAGEVFLNSGGSALNKLTPIKTGIEIYCVVLPNRCYQKCELISKKSIRIVETSQC